MSDAATPVTGSEPAGTRVGVLIAVFATALGAALSMTVLWLGMRGVMALGGFVASGGPYEIAHPAPGWVWMMPVSIVGLVFLMLLSAGMSGRYDTPSILLLAWSMLFITLGWNFLEFGLDAPGGGSSISWLVCAALFLVMGVGGAYVLVQSVRANRANDREKAEKAGLPTPPRVSAYHVATAVAIPIGVVLGLMAFGAAIA